MRTMYMMYAERLTTDGHYNGVIEIGKFNTMKEAHEYYTTTVYYTPNNFITDYNYVTVNAVTMDEETFTMEKKKIGEYRRNKPIEEYKENIVYYTEQMEKEMQRYARCTAKTTIAKIDKNVEYYKNRVAENEEKVKNYKPYTFTNYND